MADKPFTVDNLSAGGRVVATPTQLQDARVYRDLKAEAQRRDTTLEIVSDEEYAQLTGKELPKPPQPDKDGILTDEHGKKYFTISNADAQHYRRYLAAKERAAAIGVELIILP
jgi:hypothetical protein